MKATSISPILQVADLEQAVAFYCDVLGFTKEFVYGTPPYYAGVKMGHVIIHLNSIEENAFRRGLGSIYVFCDEVDDYHKAICDRGGQITSPLATQAYGIRDFQVRDPDGNVIGFGCPVQMARSG